MGKPLRLHYGCCRICSWLGNIWKFPYLAGTQGGGAFLVVYLVIMATIGAGLIMAEIAIGRAAKRNPVGAFRLLGNNIWSKTGVLGVITGFMILSFYSVVGGWTIAYLVKSIAGTVESAQLNCWRRSLAGWSRLCGSRSSIMLHSWC